MFRCPQVQNNLLLFLSGELEPQEAAAVRRHLADCPRCAAAMEKLAEMQEQIETALRTDITAPPTLDARVMATVRRLPVRRLQWPAFAPPWGWQARLRTVAAASCLLLLGYLAGRAPVIDLGDRATQPPATPQPATDIMPPGTKLLELAALRDDHLQSLAGSQAVTVKGSDPQLVSRRLTTLQRVTVSPVDLSASGARLLGGRWLQVKGVPVAFLCFDWNGRRISLYQADGRKLALPALRAMLQHQRDSETDSERCYVVAQEDDLSYVAWCVGQTNYVLVAADQPDRLLQLAERAKGIPSHA